MATKINADELADVINGYLTEYGDAAAAAIQKSAKDVAKEATRELKKGGRYQGGKDFDKGWTVATQETRLGTEVVVYNKTKPGLAHLLEFGHAISGGGRTKPRTEAFNFIAPVADAVEDQFVKAFEQAMGG